MYVKGASPFQSEGADDGDEDDDGYDDAACMTCEMVATQEKLTTLARALISPFWFFCVTAISNLSPNINLDMANTST